MEDKPKRKEHKPHVMTEAQQIAFERMIAKEAKRKGSLRQETSVPKPTKPKHVRKTKMAEKDPNYTPPITFLFSFIFKY